jgi:hypothetical protein
MRRCFEGVTNARPPDQPQYGVRHTEGQSPDGALVMGQAIQGRRPERPSAAFR